MKEGQSEIKCFFCAIQELSLEARIQELKTDRERLKHENQILQRRLLEAQKREERIALKLQQGFDF